LRTIFTPTPFHVPVSSRYPLPARGTVTPQRSVPTLSSAQTTLYHISRLPSALTASVLPDPSPLPSAVFLCHTDKLGKRTWQHSSLRTRQNEASDKHQHRLPGLYVNEVLRPQPFTWLHRDGASHGESLQLLPEGLLLATADPANIRICHRPGPSRPTLPTAPLSLIKAA